MSRRLLGTRKMETMEDFRLYRDGIGPSLITLIRAVEEEKAKVMEWMCYEIGRAVGQMEALMEYEKHPELTIFRGLEGPTSIHHRYVTEDAHAGNEKKKDGGTRTCRQVPATGDDRAGTHLHPVEPDSGNQPPSRQEQAAGQTVQ